MGINGSFISKFIPIVCQKGTGARNVLSIQKPWFWLSAKKFDLMRCKLIGELRRNSAVTYIWIESWNDHILETARQQNWKQIVHNLYDLPAEFSQSELYSQLDRGAWALLFFDGPLLSSVRVQVENLPLTADALEVFIKYVQANIVVVSYYDNTEWLIGWA